MDFIRLECRKINLQIEEEMKNEGEVLKENLAKIKTQIEAETSPVFKDFEEDEVDSSFDVLGNFLIIF